MMSTTVAAERPTRWDMSNVYSGLEGDDYRADVSKLERDLGELERWLDAQGIRRLPDAPSQQTAALADVLADVLGRMNNLQRLYETLESFIYAFFSTDSYDATAAREISKLELLDTRRQKLAVRMQGWIGSLAPRLDELIPTRPALTEHAFFLRDTARQSRYLMSEELEGLAADLTIDGASAFGKLQGRITSQLKVPLERNGKIEELPITVVHNFCFDPDPELRERAYHAELKGWDSIRTTVAACLNSVKGTAITLARRRGRASVLDAALDINQIDRATLDALLGSIREALPVFRRYLQSKANKLGREQLPWWDLFAPLGAARQTYNWSQARDLIAEKFGTFSPELGEFAAQAFDRRWIDGEPRDGKRGGAFCMAVVGREESRVLANFDGSFDQVSTLAHELGHAWHNHCQRGLEPLRRGAPMTLAETASIFCETLVTEAAMAQAGPDDQLPILEAQLQGATQVCLDISSRFLFETALFEKRAASELSPDELCELILSAQCETYGDGVRQDTYHRYMWLWKPHYYSYALNFYNFPYAFGHLFGLGLYAIYRQEGQSFIPRYRQLLRSTAQDTAARLASGFGLDITRPEFWRGSLAIVEEQVRRYERL
jgi:pepF/M3 family oligoendopeptidase